MSIASSGPCAFPAGGPNPSNSGRIRNARDRMPTAGIVPPDRTSTGGRPTIAIHAWCTACRTKSSGAVSMAGTPPVNRSSTCGAKVDSSRRARSTTSAGSDRGGSRTSSVATARDGSDAPPVPATSCVTPTDPRNVIRLSRPRPIVARPGAARLIELSVLNVALDRTATASAKSSACRMRSASASTRLGSTTAPPRRPACTAVPPVSTVSDAARRPRWPIVTVGVPSSYRSVSETITAVGRRPRSSPRTCAKPGLPTSSAPSAITTTSAGSTPGHASSAHRCANSCPLSSFAPRA